MTTISFQPSSVTSATSLFAMGVRGRLGIALVGIGVIWSTLALALT